MLIGQWEESHVPETLRCHGYSERRFVISVVSEWMEVVPSSSAIWSTESLQGKNREKKWTREAENVNVVDSC